MIIKDQNNGNIKDNKYFHILARGIILDGAIFLLLKPKMQIIHFYPADI